MKRDIMFRVWCKQSEVMNPVLKMRFDENELWYVEDEDHETQPPYFSDNDEWVLMQYTGLKDKNGKAIYEGDIVKNENTLGEIKYSIDYCGFVIHEAYGYTFIRNHSTYEVIGNIYENKDLL